MYIYIDTWKNPDSNNVFEIMLLMFRGKIILSMFWVFYCQ